MQLYATVLILIECHQVYHHEKAGVGGIKGQTAS